MKDMTTVTLPREFKSCTLEPREISRRRKAITVQHFEVSFQMLKLQDLDHGLSSYVHYHKYNLAARVGGRITIPKIQNKKMIKL